MNAISLASLNVVLEKLEEGVLFLDERRNVIAINPAAAQMIGRKHGDIVGKLCPSLFPGTGCAHTCEHSGKCSLMTADIKQEKKLVQDIVVARPDGALVPLHMWATALPSGGSLAHCAVVLRNRTREVQLEEIAGQRLRLGNLVGHSRVMQALFREILLAAASEANVLVTGESGVGKELVAQAIHDNSSRAKKPYLQVHCAALPEHLLEAELFGHSKGAFTGAATARAGRFEAADGGTLLLDEIGEIPLGTQVKLLRVLQEREVVRLGENHPRKVDVRIVAATHRDLPAMIKSGEFRADLYYRLRVLPLRVPPLRERREDVPLLATTVLSGLMSHYKRDDISLSPQAMDILLGYDWPGNVRELANALEYALVHADGAAIRPQHFPAELGSAMPPFSGYGGGNAAPAISGSGGEVPLTRYYRGPAAASEKELILAKLAEAGGNKSAAAEKLGMSRTTLWKRLKLYGIDSM
ncbi:MAG: sigma 54-interacting transcriptional regulator [Nitrosomonadales bacterium]|nr:sigma 54-interacting transcriptional regulator [Nitrosomonadales bacterium]